MDQFLNNRYVQLGGLVAGLSLVFFMMLWLVFYILKFDIPLFIPALISIGSAIWLVWKFLAYKIG